MQRTVRLEVPVDNRIEDTIRLYNVVCNQCLKAGFKNKTFNKTKLHNLTYRNVRRQHPQLNSSFVCAARDQASDILKREKLKRLPVKKKFSSIRFNHNTFKPFLDSGHISMSTTFGRIKLPVKVPEYFRRYLSWKIGAATMCIKNNMVRFYLNAEAPTPKRIKVTAKSKALGIDRGIINPVVTSDNRFFNSRHIRAVKGRYQWLKTHLQSKGTPSAKRHLKRLAGGERRFMRDVNHYLSKQIAGCGADLFVLEKLNIRRTKSIGRRFNKALGNWAYRQFQGFLEYKAEALGKTVEYVNPRHTSQRCSRCGDVRRSNRKGVWYRCPECGLSLNSDLNAARNIAALSKSFGQQAAANQPIVARCV